MIHSLSGTPITGFLRFSAAGGPTAIPIYVIAGSASAYTLAATEYVILTNITVTTNDTSQEVTIDDGAATPQVLMQGFASSTNTLAVQVPPGILASKVRAQNPRATLAGLTAAKFLDISIIGYITRT